MIATLPEIGPPVCLRFTCTKQVINARVILDFFGVLQNLGAREAWIGGTREGKGIGNLEERHS